MSFSFFALYVFLSLKRAPCLVLIMFYSFLFLVVNSATKKFPSNLRDLWNCVEVPVFATRPPFPGYRSAVGYHGGRGFGDVYGVGGLLVS